MIPAEYYYLFYLLLIIVLCYIQAYNFEAYKTTDRLVNVKQDTTKMAVIFATYIALYVGFRPISEYFADMVGYAEGYESGYFSYDSTSVRKEPVWLVIQYICSEIGFSANMWFAAVTIIQITCLYKALKSWFGYSVYPAFLFLATAFYFWSTLTVIIRSGLAAAMVVYAMSLFMKEKKSYQIRALCLMIVALYTHTSSFLISGCFLISYFFLKNIKISILIWTSCLLLSLIAGSFFEDFFISLGFDDRINLIKSRDYEGFSREGFRWDFLLYSCIPLIIAFVVLNRKKIVDNKYVVLANTYIMCNAFWILIIRAQFSDRFAGLSWVLYPIVIAYPYLKMKIWSNQPSKARLALLAHVGFTSLMYFLYYGLLKNV